MKSTTKSLVCASVLSAIQSFALAAGADGFVVSSESGTKGCSKCVSEAPTVEQRLPSETAVERPKMTTELNAICDLTNVQRIHAGLPPLVADPTLMQLACDQCQSMARQQQLSHSIEGRSFSDRLRGSGYVSASAGENIAEGQLNGNEAVQDWMHSAGHRANIMNRQYTHIGVAMSTSKSGQRFYAQVFARPMSLTTQTGVCRGPNCRVQLRAAE